MKPENITAYTRLLKNIALDMTMYIKKFKLMDEKLIYDYLCNETTSTYSYLNYLKSTLNVEFSTQDIRLAISIILKGALDVKSNQVSTMEVNPFYKKYYKQIDSMNKTHVQEINLEVKDEDSL